MDKVQQKEIFIFMHPKLNFNVKCLLLFWNTSMSVASLDILFKNKLMIILQILSLPNTLQFLSSEYRRNFEVLFI